MNMKLVEGRALAKNVALSCSPLVSAWTQPSAVSPSLWCLGWPTQLQALDGYTPVSNYSPASPPDSFNKFPGD